MFSNIHFNLAFCEIMWKYRSIQTPQMTITYNTEKKLSACRVTKAVTQTHKIFNVYCFITD